MRFRTRDMTIAMRFMIGLLLIALPALVVSLGGVFLASRHMLTERLVAHLDTMASLKANAFEAYADESLRDIRSLTLSPAVLEGISVIREAYATDGPRSDAYRQAEERFRPLLTRFGNAFGYHDLFLIAPDGTIVFSLRHEADFATSLTDGPHARTGLASVFRDVVRDLRPSLSPLEHYQPSGAVASFIAAPVLDGGRLVGIVAAQLGSDALYRIVADHTGMGETGETVLGRRDGDALLIVSPLRSRPDAAFQQRIAIDQEPPPPLALAVQGEAGSAVTTDGHGVAALAAWRPLPTLGLGMVVKIDAAEAFADADWLNRLALVLGLGTMAAVVVASLLLARAITLPVRHLRQASEAIAAGDYSVYAKPGGGRELACLAASFNVMARRVAATEADLRHSLQEKTALVAEVQRARETAAANEATLRMVFNSAADGIVTIGEDGAMLSVNIAMERLFGYSVMEMIGRNVAMLMPETHRSRHDGYLQAFLTTGNKKVIGQRRELTARRKDGSEFAIELSVSALSDDNGKWIFTGILSDITARRAADAQIRKLSRAVEASPVSVLISDARGNIEYVNPTFVELTGYQADEVIGRNPSFLKSGKTSPEDYAHMWRTISSGATWHGEFHNRRKDGGEYWVAASISPIRGEGGEIVNFVAVEEDITERRTAEEDLRKAKAQAETANQAKSEFLSRMSHELRTPMNAILGFTQLMRTSKKEPLTAKQQSYLEMIEKGGDHLLALINEVLDLARIEAGRMVLSIEDIDMVPLFDECLSLTRTMADRRGITVIDQTEGSAVRLRADYTRTKQVLLNLLSNAVKYNREGGTITLALAPGAEGRLRILVADTGPGIAPDRQAELFVPFSRLDADTTEVEGTGIGLTITRKLVEQMAGEVGFDSTLGVGSTFWFELPLADPAAAPAAPAEAVADPPHELTLEGSRLLLYVEDNPANLRLMEEIVGEVDGLELISAHTAVLGLELAASKHPDVIILDINLPGLDGIGAVKRLRALPQTRRTPIFALSANAMPSTIRQALEAGFDKYLTKPVKIAEVMAALGEALERKP